MVAVERLDPPPQEDDPETLPRRPLVRKVRPPVPLGGLEPLEAFRHEVRGPRERFAHRPQDGKRPDPTGVEALRGLDREPEVVRGDPRPRSPLRPEAGLVALRLPGGGRRGRGEVVGAAPRRPAPHDADDEHRETCRREGAAGLPGPARSEGLRRGIVVGEAPTERQAGEHPVAPAVRVGAFAGPRPRLRAAQRAAPRSTPDPALEGQRVDEPFGELAGALRLPDRGEKPGVSDEADPQLLRGAAGTVEVLNEPLDLVHDAPGPVVRIAGRQGREPAQRQAAVFEERLAQVPPAARGDEEDPPRLRAEERQEPGADEGQRMDPGHLVPVKRLQPGPEPLRADDGGEQDAVVAPPLRRPPFPPGRDVGRAGKQSSAPGGEDRPPAAADHMGGRLAPEVLLDQVDEDVDEPRRVALESPPEPGVSHLLRRELSRRGEGAEGSPIQADPARADDQHGPPRAQCRPPSRRSAPSRTNTTQRSSAPSTRVDTGADEASAPAPPRPGRRARRSS